jgi:pimeloyl-ACP methyl ester carboxylesterase/SAM-dependent methyltransferase
LTVATYVLIHGRGDSASNFDLLGAELLKRGRDVVAVDLPIDDDSAGWAEYADTVVDAIGDRRNLVVVGHSLGGFTAPLVVTRVRADLLVLVQAMVPLPDETAGEWWSNTGHSEAVSERYVDGESAIELVLHDVPRDVAVAALAKTRDQSMTPMAQPWPLAAWPDVPTRFLLCRDDRFFPADFMRRVVRERLGIEPDEMDGGHFPHLSRPAELADRLEAYRSDVVDEHARRLAADDPTDWFERLYAAAAEGEAVVPWDRGAPHRLLVEWARGLKGDGRRALVVGSGLGEDAELVAGLGFDTTAFDISPTAIETTRRRFPQSRVRYLAADLLDPPADWHQAFELVVESLTVQSMPNPHRTQAIPRVASLVAPGGTLLVIATGRDEGPEPSGPPWPLTRTEIDAFATDGVEAVRIEELRDADDPGLFRWRAEFRRS